MSCETCSKETKACLICHKHIESNLKIFTTWLLLLLSAIHSTTSIDTNYYIQNQSISLSRTFLLLWSIFIWRILFLGLLTWILQALRLILILIKLTWILYTLLLLFTLLFSFLLLLFLRRFIFKVLVKVFFPVWSIWLIMHILLV